MHTFARKMSSEIDVEKKMKWIGGLETVKTARYTVVESPYQIWINYMGPQAEANKQNP